MQTNHRTETSKRSATTLPAWAAIGALVATVGLVGCDRAGDGRTAGQRVDETTARVEQRSENAADKVKQEARETGTAVRNAVDDAAITASVNAQLARDKELSALRIDVDTVDGKVALKGTAPNETARERATQIASAVQGVRTVDNQLVVGKG